MLIDNTAQKTRKEKILTIAMVYIRDYYFKNESPLETCVYSLQRNSLENIKYVVICRLRFGARALPMTTCHGMPLY